MTSSFDIESVSRTRPVMVPYLHGGIYPEISQPAVRIDGRFDWTLDLVRAKEYFDPVVNIALFTLLGEGKNHPGVPGVRHNAGLPWPDLVGSSQQQIEKWKEDAKNKLEPLFETCKRLDLKLIPVCNLFVCCGEDTVDEWYHNVENWSELTLDGKTVKTRLSVRSLNNDAERFREGRACLAHPKLEEVLDRCVSLVKELGLDKDPTIIGWQGENEPRVQVDEGPMLIGGNPHTKSLFKEYLKKVDGDIDGFNSVAGTEYKSFDEVDIGDDNWVVNAYYHRFIPWLVTIHHENGIVKRFKKNMPNQKFFTRFQCGPTRFTGAGGDMTYLPEMDTDYLGFSFYPWHRKQMGQGQRGQRVTGVRLGYMGLLCSMLKNYEGDIAFTEYGVIRGYDGQSVITVPRDYEHINMVYRSLYYQVKFICYFLQGGNPGNLVYNLYGLNYLKSPENLKIVKQVKDELERIKPYQTFGKPITNPLAILVSRNANHYPGMGGAFYGELFGLLMRIMEAPEWSCFDVIEEHTPNLEERITEYSGLIVYDACLEDTTREILERISTSGKKLLIICAPHLMNSRYRAIKQPQSYPMNLRQQPPVNVDNVRELTPCITSTGHQLLEGIDELDMERPVAITPKDGATSILKTKDGEVVGTAAENIVLLSGVPLGLEELKKLYLNFERWVGIKPVNIFVSHFENAVVIQNYQSAKENVDGTFSEDMEWYGSVNMNEDGSKLQVYEVRGDFPWLAYERTDGQISMQGIHLDMMEVKAFRNEVGKEQPHFEGVPDTVGFREFVLGPVHVVGEFRVSESGSKVIHFAPGFWSGSEIGWKVNEIGSQKILSEGNGMQISFDVTPGKSYYIIVRKMEAHPDRCPLCDLGWYK